MSSPNLHISPTSTISLSDSPSSLVGGVSGAQTPAGFSVAPTLVDCPAVCDKLEEKVEGAKQLQDEADTITDEKNLNLNVPSPSSEDSMTAVADDRKPEAKLSQGRKWTLLAIMSLSLFIDVWCYSAFIVLTDPITIDLGVPFTQQPWVITSYSVAFASFLLFWGRVSDLYSAKPVFTGGFFGLGILSLIISFLPDRYSFFIFRAIAGVAGAALVPSAYRIIVKIFEPHELGKAFTLYGISGALANVSGTLIAGVIDLIPGGGQMKNWRWFFRILTIIIFPAAAVSYALIPQIDGEDSVPNSDSTSQDSEAESQIKTPRPKWQRLDIIGALLMLSAIILLILGLTFGASYGWKTASFLVPFLLSFVLFPAFFVWEAYIPEDMALLPAKTWQIPNFTLLIVFALQVYPYWGVEQLASIQQWMIVHHESGIMAAVRLLPQGVIAFAVTMLLTFVTSLTARPRWTILLGGVLGIVGYILFVIPDNYAGTDYWRWFFPASIIGSGGMMAVFTSTNVAVMSSVPPAMSGVAGATLQTAMQMGGAVGFGIQSGLLTVHPGSIENPANIHTSYYFQLGWSALWLIGFAVFYRPRKTSDDDEERVVAAH